MKTSTKGLLMVLISGIVFGIMPSMVTFCYKQGATATVVLLARYTVLAALMLPIVIRQKNAMGNYRRYWKKLLLISAFSASTPLLLFTGYKYMPTGVVTTIHFMYPTVVMLMCVLIFHDKISKLKLICLALCVSGILLMLQFSGGEINAFGLMVTLCSSITWASYMVALDKSDLGDMPSEQLVLFVEIASSVFVGLYGIVSGEGAVSITREGWIAMIATSLVVSVFGVMFFAIGVRHTDAQVSAIASTLEPLTSLFVGVLFLNEPFSLRSFIGAVLILSAVVLLSLFNEKESFEKRR